MAAVNTLQSILSGIGALASKIRRPLKWAWRGALALIGISAIFWTGALLIGSCRLEAKLKEVRSDPQYSTLIPKDWSRPGPGENAAPYFSAAFALVSWPDSKEPLQINDILQGHWSRISEVQRKAITDWVAQNGRAFELARLGADRPWCRFYRQWDAKNAPNPRTMPREMGWLYQMEWMLIARAWVEASRGSHRDARETIRVALSVADSLRDDPFLESQKTRLSAHEMVLESLLTLIPAEASEAELEEWLKVVPRPGSFDGCLERGVRWEIHSLADLLSGPIGRFWAQWSQHIPSYRQYEKALQRRLADPLVKWDGIRALEDLARVREICSKPYLEGRIEAQQMMDKKRSDGWNPVRANFVHSPYYALEILQDVRARCVVLRTGLEWEQIRLRKGKYPEKCDAIDPLTGNPLLVESGPLRLTSVGGQRPKYLDEPPISWVLRAQ